MTRRPVPLRIDEEILTRLDRVAEALSAKAAGANVPRSDAIRIALERGTESLEGELGLSRQKRKPKR
jgi:hypothetical protein